MKNLLLLFSILLINYCPILSAQRTGIVVSTPNYEEWAKSVSRETEFQEWLDHVTAIKKKFGLTSCLKSAYVDTFVGQMAILKEERVSKDAVDAEYSQKLDNEPFEFSVVTCSDHNGNHLDNITVGGALVSPESSNYQSLQNFRAVWIPLTFDPSLIGDLKNSYVADFSSFRYLGPVDYFLHNFYLNSIELGLGVIGTEPTNPKFFNELKRSHSYYGTVTVVKSDLNGERIFANGKVIVEVDAVKKVVNVNIKYPFLHVVEWTLPFPKSENFQKDDNIWIGFFGPEGVELGGTFFIDDQDLKIQGVFGAKKTLK